MYRTRQLLGAIALIFISSNVFAAGLGERAEDTMWTLNHWFVVLVISAAFIGIAIMISGGLQLKKYADNPQQNPISKPLIYLVSGIIIFGLSATSETMLITVFGKDRAD